ISKRKLYPSIYRLVQNGEISDDFAVVGTARRPWTHEVFRDTVKESIHEHESAEREIDAFLSHFYYHPLDVRDSVSYEKMEELLHSLGRTYRTEGHRVFYSASAAYCIGGSSNN